MVADGGGDGHGARDGEGGDAAGGRTARPTGGAVPDAAFTIPWDRLPAGFGTNLNSAAASPAAAVPAATVVLARDTGRGMAVYLLRRNRSAGFVPGAYVFPGGRVDAADADPGLAARAVALPAEPGAAYWMAAVREVFEETGVLLADGPADAAALAALRDALLEERATLRDVLDATGSRIDLRRTVHFAHWITPVAEPRRFDTHFFLAALPDGAEARADAREMSDALWLAPAEALARFRAARLPMVFPTVRTLEALAGFDTVAAALDELRGRPVHPVLPRLVQTGDGIGIAMDSRGDA
jgi:recombination protein RecT